MKRASKYLVTIILGLFLQSCALCAVYGTLQAINNVSSVLNMIHVSMRRIPAVLKEGANIKRAAEEGRLISTLAESIPNLIANQFDKAVEDKIHIFSGDLKTTAMEFTKHALDENLTDAMQTYNTMTNIYNQLSDLMVDLKQSAN